MMRPAILAAMAILALGGCNRRGAAADGESSRGLQVEAYDPPIPKAPLKGKLETLAQHPEDAAASSAASGTPPAASSQAPPQG